MSAPNANKLFITREIGNWIRDLIKLHLATELGVSAANGEIRFSDLMEVPIQLIKNMIPGVFISALDVPNKWGSVDGSDYISDYRFRIVYAAALSTGEQLETARMKGERIADLLVENADMENPTVPGVYQSAPIYCYVTGLEFKPDENDLVQSLNADYYAMAVNVTVQRHTFTDS